MKPRQVQSSCSCTTCLYGSESESQPSRRVKGGTKIERLFYDKYLPLRERKLVDKLIKTRAVYDDVRNQILSRSNVTIEEKANVKLKGDRPFHHDIDDVERSSALLEIVSLVDKGDGISLRLSECCSCCTCRSKSELHDKRYRDGRHVTHHHARGGSRLSSQSGVISKRRAKEVRRYRSRGVQFKHIRSDPCTCTLKLLSKQKLSTTALQKQEKQGVRGATRLLSNVGEGARKSVKKIRHTTSKIKNQCQCFQEKSIEKLKLAKYSMKEKLDSMQTQYVKRHETIPVDELGMKVKKDSITKFREKLRRRKLEREFECEHECSEEECVPEDCLEKLNLRRAKRQKREKKLLDTSLETGTEKELKRTTIKEKVLHSPRVNIEMGSKAAKKVASNLCACTISLRKSIKSSVKLKTSKSKSSTYLTTTSTDQLKNVSYRKRKLGINTRGKKRRSGPKTRYQSASSGTSHSVSTVRKPTPRFDRAEQSAPNVGKLLKETGFSFDKETDNRDKETTFMQNKTMLKTTKKHDRPSQAIKGKSTYTSNNYGLRRCFCTLKLTQSQKVKSKVKKGKETSNQTIFQHVPSTSEETNTSKIASQLPPSECECPVTIKKRENNIEKRKKRHQSTGNRLVMESKSSHTPRRSSKVASLPPSECECSAIMKKRENNTEKRKNQQQSTGNQPVMESKSSFTPRKSSKVASLLPYECEPGVCTPEKCGPYECLEIVNKRYNVRKRNRRHKSSNKRFIMESKSSFTPTATPHRAKKVQSSMFAYKTEVQTQYNNNYRNSPEEANRIQEIPRLSGLPTVKISSSFSFNIEISKGLPLPMNELSDHVDRQSTYEPPKAEPMTREEIKNEIKTYKSILKNKNKGPKKVNKGTHATTKSKNRIKCMCNKLYKKPKERPIVQHVSTSTETHLPPVGVTKATKTKKSKIYHKIVVGPYECEPNICVPGQCNPYECLNIIKRRNQQFSKETGTTVDQRRRKTSSSFTDNVKMSEKAVPVRTRGVNQPTIVFNKEARRPAIIKHTSKERRQPKRQAVKVGSSFSFSLEFSKNRLPDSASFEPPFKERSVQFFENNNDSKIKSIELEKHNKENRLKRCFCTLKLRNQKTNVFAINKFILDKNQAREKKSVAYSTNQSKLSFVGSRYGFNFKEMQSYFNENKSFYKGRSFNGRYSGSDDVDTLNEVNLKNCYTFSEACCIQRNKKVTVMNLKEDWISYKSFSTTFSKSDVTGVSPLLKRCFCTMNIRIQEMENNACRRYKLKSYECVPGICVSGECNPNDCQKLIQKRLIKKSSKMSEASIGYKSISSNTFRQTPHLRETTLQVNSQGGYRPRQRRGKPPSGIRYKSLPNKSHKQAVRIGSKFSLNIEFSKDKLQLKEDRVLVEKRPSHMRSKPIRAMHREHRTEGTSNGPSTSDRYLQSGIRTRDMESNTDKMLKRCFCTLKLQKTEKERKYHDRSNYVAIKEIRKKPSTLTTAQNTRAFKPERSRRILDPNKCEPGICVPGQCDPYECLEKIKMRYKNTRDFGSGLGQPQRRSTSSITSKQKVRKRGRNIQSRFPEKPVKSTISTIEHSELPSVRQSGKSSRQAVRVGSSFSFNIEFFKDKQYHKTRPVKVSYPKSNKIRTSSKTIGYLRTNVKGRGVQDSRAINLKDSQASTLSRMKSTMTTSFLKRCFCTAKLQGVKNVPDVIQPTPRMEAEKIQTDKITTRAPKNIPQKFEPNECPPGVCVPAPGECDYYACLRKNNRRNKVLGTDMERSKSSYSSFKPPKQRKSRKVQNNKDHKRPEDIKRPRDTKGLRSYPPGDIKRPRDSKLLRSYPTRKSETKTFVSISGDSKRRQAVRIGSTFSFDIEFYKDKTPRYDEIQAAARKLKHRSQKTGNKENKRHQGSNGAVAKTFDQISQVSKTKTDRSMGTLPKRCFCVLKLQKKSQFNAAKIERKLPRSAINRGMMTKNRHVRENPPERRQISYKLEPYECEPGVCISGECDPNECLLRIQKRNMKESGTTTRYCGARSVSSLASRAINVSRRVQYGSRPPKITESAKIRSHQPRARKYRQIPLKQVVRIGSCYSFNVEFFKDRSYNESNPRTKVMRMQERKYKGADKSSLQSIGSKPQGSQDSKLVHHRDSQSLIPKMRSSMTDAQFLKRCFCTLKLQKSNRTLNPTMNMRNQKVYLATMHNLSPYECEPGFCIPYQCDPYECEKRIRQRMKQSKLTGMRNPNVRSSSSNAVGVLNQTRSVQGAPWTRGAGVSSTRVKKTNPAHMTDKHRDYAVKSHRQEVRIGSNFSFNIEFFKHKPSYESQGDQMLEKEYIPTKSKTGNPYHPKGKHMYSQIDDPRSRHMYSQYDPRGRHMYSQYDPRGRDTSSQVNLAQTQSRGVGQLHKSCFCTLKLQKFGKHEREILKKGRIIQTSKSFKPPTRHMTQGSVGTATSKKIKKERVDMKDMGAKTQTKKYRLLPYECEPGVCTPGLCDPYECLERIKQRELRNFGTSTGKNMRERYVDVGSKSKTMDKAQKMRHKARKPAYTTFRQRIHTPSYIAPKNENITNYPPGRQTVRIGSSFSFNIEFFKDKPYSVKDMQIDRETEFQDNLYSKSGKIRHEKGNIIRPGKRNQKDEMIGPGKRNATICTASKVCNTVTRLNCSKECQNFPNTECKSTGMGPFLKRCFCTLKLQKPDYSRLERSTQKSASRTGIKLTNLNKKTATKRFRPPKTIEEHSNLLPYECEPGFCTPGQCNPYVCLERIKQRNKTKKIGTNLYPSQKSAISGYCPGPYCTESCQTDGRTRNRNEYLQQTVSTDARPRNRDEYLQQTDSTVEEHRFQNVFGSQQGVRYGSNISFNIEFYKEQLAPDFIKVKAAESSNDNIGRYKPTENQTQYAKPKKGTKQIYANDKFHTTANTQSEGIRLENKGTGVINTLKRCFCTLNLQKGALGSSKQKIVTVNRLTIEDNRGPFGNFPCGNLKKTIFGNTSVVYRTENIHTKFYKKRRKGGETQVLYPYTPRKFNKNISKTLLRYENKHTNLKRSCPRLKPRNIWPSLNINRKRVRRLTAKHSEYSLKVNTPEYSEIIRNKSSSSKITGFRSVVSRCKQMFSKRIKDSKMSANLENNRTQNKYCKVDKFKSVPLPIENKNMFKINWQPKFSTEVSNPMQSKKYLNRFDDSKNNSILKTTSRRKCKSEKAVVNMAQPPRDSSYNNKVICSYAQIQYENNKLKPANFSLVIRPNQNFLGKGQNDKNKILDNKLGSSEENQVNGCDCESMCKCENCTGDWRTMLAEKREARRIKQRNTVIGKCMNALKTNLSKKKEPFLKPKEKPVLQRDDICSRCCKNKNHIDPKSLCQGIVPGIIAKQSVIIKGMPTDGSTDICTCKSPCPCENCHRNARISELCKDPLSPQKYLLISDNNYQTTVTEACLCENLNKNDIKSIHTPNDIESIQTPLREACTCMSCPYQKSPATLKFATGAAYADTNEARTNIAANVTGLSKVPEAGQINLNEAVNLKKKKPASKVIFGKIKNICKTKPFQKNCSVSCPNKMSNSCQKSLCDNCLTVGTKAAPKTKNAAVKQDHNLQTYVSKNNIQDDPKSIQKRRSDLCTCKTPCSCQKTPAYVKVNEFSCGDYPFPQKYMLLTEAPKTDQVNISYNTTKYDAKKQKLEKKKLKLERKKQELEKKKQERETRKQERKTETLEKTTQMHKQPGDLCSCKFPCPCDRTPKHVHVNEFSCNDDVLPQKYIFLRDGSQIVEEDINNIGHETAKKQKSKKIKRDPKKKDKIKQDQTTQVLKHPDDLCSCKFPCPCQRTPDKVHVNEFSCDSNVVPQKYLFLSDSPQNVQFSETSEYDAKKRKLEKKKQKHERKQQKQQELERKKQEREHELEAQRRKREIDRLGKVTQTQKPPGDLCSCKFPCSCNRTPETVDVKEFSCNDNVLPQKYLLISDSPHFVNSIGDGQSNVGHDTAKIDAKKKKLEKKKKQDERKKQEREAQKRKRAMDKIGKITQTQKSPGDLCSCKFPCSCDRTFENVNVKEFSCNDDVLPQKYLLISDSPQLGNSLRDGVSNVGYETAKYDAIKQKLERKKKQHERKKEEREAKNQKHDKDKLDQATQMHKHPNDLCTCKFPCHCKRTRKNVSVAELACNDWPSPQKYLLLSDTFENDNLEGSEVGHDTLKQDKKKQKIDLKKLKRDSKKQDTEKQKRNKLTQIRKHSNDLCSCNFPCSCQKPHENLKVSELACNDWPSPQRYLLLSEVSKIDNLKLDQKTTGTLETLETVQLPKANRIDALEGIQIYTKDIETLETVQLPKTNRLDALEGIQIYTKDNKLNSLETNRRKAFVDVHFNTDASQNVAHDEIIKRVSKQLQVDDDNVIVKHDSKKLKKKEKRENKKQKQIGRNRIHKHRSELCTCKTPCSCQKSAKNVTEFSCGDSPIPQKYLLVQGDHNDVSKSCQATDSKECQQPQFNADIAQTSDNNKEKQNIQNRQHKHRSDLCTCILPFHCDKCAKEIGISQFSGGDWPIPQTRLLVTSDHQTSNPQIQQVDIPDDSRKVASEICQFDSPIYEKRKIKKQKENKPKQIKMSKQNRIQQTPKDREDLCICPFPCPCQKCPKTLDVTEFSLDDWPSPRRCLFVDDNERNTKGNTGVCTSDIWKFKTGAKFEFFPGKAKKIKSAERRKVSKLFGKTEKQKRTKLKEHWEVAENVRRDAGRTKQTRKEHWEEAENVRGDAGRTKQTRKEHWEEAENVRGDAGRNKQTRKEQWEEAENVKRSTEISKHTEKDQWRETDNVKEGKAAKAKTGKANKDTGKAKKKKIQKNKLLGIENETQTQMDSVGGDLQKSSSVTSRATKVVAQVKSISNKLKFASKKMENRFKWLEDKCKKCKKQYIPDPCICGIPECEKEMMAMRHKKKITPEKICKCGVPTCEEKTKTFKALLLNNVKSKKSNVKSVTEYENKSKTKKSKKSKFEPESEFESEYKPKKYKKSKKTKLEPESASDVENTRKKSKKSKLKPESESEYKPKKSKKSKKSKVESDSDVEQTRKKSKKSKISKLDTESDSDNANKRKTSKKSKRQSEPETNSKSKKSKLQPVSPGSKSKKSKGQPETALKTKRSFFVSRAECVCSQKRSPQATCLCDHTCLCASEAAKAKAKAKDKSKTKTKPKSKKPKQMKKPKKPAAKKKPKKKPKKPSPGPFARCAKSINKSCERRRRRAARRRNTKKAVKHIKKCAKACAKNVDQVKKNVASTQAMRSITNTLEQHYVSNFIIHARNPKKRFKPKVKKGKEPIDFECSLFMGSLRRRPWLSIYYMCPWFYPHCISCLNIWKQFTDVILFLLAVGVWSPCILAIEVCRAFVCCTFCTG